MEYLDVLDEKGNLTGKKKPRDEVHRDGDWHRTVYVWIMNAQGELLIQKRSPNKESAPNKWDASAAGHVEAGDWPINAGVREVKEELGIELKTEQLQYLFTDRTFADPAKPFKNNQFNEVFVAKVDVDLSQIKIQEEEVSEVRFLSINDLKKEIREGKEDYCNHVIKYIKPFENSG